MKLFNILLVAFSLFLTDFIVAQSNIEIKEQGGSVALNGDTLKVSVDENNQDYLNFGVIPIHIDVTNKNVNSIKIAITRVIISEPSQWSDQVCWGDGCYDALTDPYTTPNTGGFPAPTLDNGVAFELKPQYDPKNVKGVGHYRYYLTAVDNGNTHVDSVDVLLSFGTNSIKTINEEGFKFNISPNPASDFVNIAIQNSNEELNLKIVDVLGNEILSDKIKGAKKLDVSNLKSGIYFVTIISSDKKVVSRKMILRH